MQPRPKAKAPPATVCPSPLCAPVDGRAYTRSVDHNIPFSFRVITGNSHPSLAEDVAALVGYEMMRRPNGTLLTPDTFANGEISIRYVTCLRGDDVFVVHPTCPNGRISVNDAILELLLMLHTARLSSAKRVTAIVPYIAYGRQSMMSSEGTPIAASAVAQMLQSLACDYLVTVDLSVAQIQGFFHHVPVTNISSTPIFRRYLQSQVQRGNLPPVDRLVIAAIGPHNVARAKELADMLGVWRCVTILPRRVVGNESFTRELAHRPTKTLQLDGATSCAGMVCITVDDIIDTVLTTATAVQMLMGAGAEYVISCATHGLFTTGAIQRVNDCEGLRECIVTDTTPQQEHCAQCPKLTVLTVSALLSMAVKRIHFEKAEKEDDWETRMWNEYDFDLAVCPISVAEHEHPSSPQMRLPVSLPSLDLLGP
eukprot:EG_transcript_11880